MNLMTHEMNPSSDAALSIQKIVGLFCSRKEVGRGRSLSLGFGDHTLSTITINDKVYREWEIGTYRCAWRVVRGGIVVCGSQDAVDSIDGLNVALARVELGRFASLRNLTELDVRVEFDNEVATDFLAAASDDDECLHIFCPGQLYIQFSVRAGWTMGPTDKPWK
jgi:hypothetical protein